MLSIFKYLFWYIVVVEGLTIIQDRFESTQFTHLNIINLALIMTPVALHWVIPCRLLICRVWEMVWCCPNALSKCWSPSLAIYGFGTVWKLTFFIYIYWREIFFKNQKVKERGLSSVKIYIWVDLPWVVWTESPWWWESTTIFFGGGFSACSAALLTLVWLFTFMKFGHAGCGRSNK